MRFIPQSCTAWLITSLDCCWRACPCFLAGQGRVVLCSSRRAFSSSFIALVQTTSWASIASSNTLSSFSMACSAVALLIAPRALPLPGEHHGLVYAIGMVALLMSVTTRIRAQGSQSSETL